jgi:hypothetical protein
MKLREDVSRVVTELTRAREVESRHKLRLEHLRKDVSKVGVFVRVSVCMCLCVCAHIYTYMHTYTHTCISCVCVYIHAYMHAYTRT